MMNTPLVILSLIPPLAKIILSYLPWQSSEFDVMWKREHSELSPPFDAQALAGIAALHSLHRLARHRRQPCRRRQPRRCFGQLPLRRPDTSRPELQPLAAARAGVCRRGWHRHVRLGACGAWPICLPCSGRRGAGADRLRDERPAAGGHDDAAGGRPRRGHPREPVGAVRPPEARLRVLVPLPLGSLRAVGPRGQRGQPAALRSELRAARRAGLLLRLPAAPPLPRVHMVPRP
jgi:hypothetical protein